MNKHNNTINTKSETCYITGDYSKLNLKSKVIFIQIILYVLIFNLTQGLTKEPAKNL